MKTPPLFIGLLLIFWGTQTDNILIGLVVAILLEGPHFVQDKWTLSDEDYVRISDLTSIIFITSISLILLNKEPIFFFRITTTWLPIILLPLITAQLYSTQEKIIIGTRIGGKKNKIGLSHKPLDFRIYYIAICFFSAAAGNSRALYFFPVAISFICWLMFWNRGKSFTIWIFLCCIALITTTGYSSFILVVKTQQYLEQRSRTFWRGYYSDRYADPFKAHIAYGKIGRLKLSGKILIRVSPESDQVPAYLYEASYNLFTKNSWHNSHRPFISTPLVTKSTWHIVPKPHPTGKIITVEQNLPKEKGILVRPPGSFTVTAPNLYELTNNNEGILKATDSAPAVISTFSYTGQRFRPDDIPDKRNTRIPEEELPAITQITTSIWKGGETDLEKLSTLNTFFSINFTYTLNLQNKGKHNTLLSNFLLMTKQGHCELFASATALILRSAGIPTRYVTGFAVDEFSKFEGKYIVRSRHAHAWCEAFINGNWLIVDNTPPDWLNLDHQNSSLFEPLQDFFNYFRLKFTHFKISTEQSYNIQLSIVIVVLSSFLAIRIYRRMQAKKIVAKATLLESRIFSPQPSPFNKIITELSARISQPMKNEPFLHWVERNEEQLTVSTDSIRQLYSLHQKLRFNNENFTQQDMKCLEKGVKNLLASLPQAIHSNDNQSN